MTKRMATRGHGAAVIRLLEVKQDARNWNLSGRGQERWQHAILRIKLTNRMAHFAQEASAARIESEKMQAAADLLWQQEVEAELLLASKPFIYRLIRWIYV